MFTCDQEFYGHLPFDLNSMVNIKKIKMLSLNLNS